MTVNSGAEDTLPSVPTAAPAPSELAIDHTLGAPNFPSTTGTDLETEILQAVIEARSRGEDGVLELQSALDHRSRKRRESAVRVLELLIRILPDESQRLPFLRLLIASVGHKRRDVRTEALWLLQRVQIPGSIPALVSRLRRVRKVNSNCEGTIGASSFLAFLAISLSEYAPSPVNKLHGLFETHAWIPVALLGAFLVFLPLSFAFRLRGMLLSAPSELMEVMRALDRQELALADDALKDLRTIASVASGNSSELRNGARGLIRRIEAAKSQHGPLPIPSTASSTDPEALPVATASE